MPRPPELERDVQFWIRVYTQIDTNSGFLHDQYNLGVVYDTLHFAARHRAARAPAPSSTRRASAWPRRSGASPQPATRPLSAEDQRIKELWGAEGTPGAPAGGGR